MGLDHSPSNALDFEIEDYASTEFRRIGSDRIGRQTQSWVRFAEGWRVVAAHVSVLM
jgi:hypothetical protein